MPLSHFPYAKLHKGVLLQRVTQGTIIATINTSTRL